MAFSVPEPHFLLRKARTPPPYVQPSELCSIGARSCFYAESCRSFPPRIACQNLSSDKTLGGLGFPIHPKEEEPSTHVIAWTKGRLKKGIENSKMGRNEQMASSSVTIWTLSHDCRYLLHKKSTRTDEKSK